MCNTERIVNGFKEVVKMSYNIYATLPNSGQCISWKKQLLLSFCALTVMLKDMPYALSGFVFSSSSLSVLSLFKSQTLLKLPSDNPLHSVPSLKSLLRASANSIT